MKNTLVQFLLQIRIIISKRTFHKDVDVEKELILETDLVVRIRTKNNSPAAGRFIKRYYVMKKVKIEKNIRFRYSTTQKRIFLKITFSTKEKNRFSISKKQYKISFPYEDFFSN